MPKIYSETERTDIKDSLKREANILMIERGIKKTTVDELVKRAGIPKGTFYLFYPSKEMLLFECIQDFHNEADKIISDGMEQIIRKYKSRTKGKRFSNECLDEITDVLMEAINITRGSCLKIMLDPESMNLLISKLPEDVLKKHGNDSKENILLEFFGIKDKEKIQAISGSFTLILLGLIYSPVLGDELAEKSTRLLVRGVVNQMVEAS
ncbi:MAG: helix-turn-helix transcriptional regulator [Lachnospiraceae bacterium]|nr:helix-turn-helix transcriptional regulator [Lachnospiraceae bacterium]